jgi:hypothetical protein
VSAAAAPHLHEVVLRDPPPAGHVCAVCETDCDDVLAIRRENKLLKFFLLGALWCAASASRPRPVDVAAIADVERIAGEAFNVSAALSDIPPDLLAVLFPDGSPSAPGAP